MVLCVSLTARTDTGSDVTDARPLPPVAHEPVPKPAPSEKVSPSPVLAQGPPGGTVVEANLVRSVVGVPDQSAGAGHRITEVHGVTTVVEVSQGDAPRFTRPIQPCVVIEGQSCTFTAILVGEPWPEITWLKEKEDFAKTERHKMAVDATTGSCSLTIVDCRPSDTGVYSCRATNLAGRATCTANIVVVRE